MTAGTVPMTAAAPGERMTAIVAVEQDDAFRPYIRLELATDRGMPRGAPMTADEALRLADLLTRAARRVASR